MAKALCRSKGKYINLKQRKVEISDKSYPNKSLLLLYRQNIGIPIAADAADNTPNITIHFVGELPSFADGQKSYTVPGTLSYSGTQYP